VHVKYNITINLTKVQNYFTANNATLKYFSKVSFETKLFRHGILKRLEFKSTRAIFLQFYFNKRAMGRQTLVE